MKNSCILIVFTLLISTCALSFDKRFARMIVALPESKFRMEGDIVYMPVRILPRVNFGFQVCSDPEVREEECEDAQVIASEVAWNLCTASRVVNWSEAFSQKCAVAMSTLSDDIDVECQRLAREYAERKKNKQQKTREEEFAAMPDIHEFLASAELGARAAGLQVVTRAERGMASVPGASYASGNAVGVLQRSQKDLRVHMNLAVEADIADLRVAAMTGDTRGLPAQSRLGGVVHGAVEHVRGSVRALAGAQQCFLAGGRHASVPTRALEDGQWQAESGELGFSAQNFDEHAWVDGHVADLIDNFFEPVMNEVRAYEKQRAAIIRDIEAGRASDGAEDALRIQQQRIDDAAQGAGQNLAIRLFMESAGMTYEEAAALFEG